MSERLHLATIFQITESNEQSPLLTQAIAKISKSISAEGFTCLRDYSHNNYLVRSQLSRITLRNADSTYRVGITGTHDHSTLQLSLVCHGGRTFREHAIARDNIQLHMRNTRSYPASADSNHHQYTDGSFHRLSSEASVQEKNDFLQALIDAQCDRERTKKDYEFWKKDIKYTKKIFWMEGEPLRYFEELFSPPPQDPWYEKLGYKFAKKAVNIIYGL